MFFFPLWKRYFVARRAAADSRTGTRKKIKFKQRKKTAAADPAERGLPWLRRAGACAHGRTRPRVTREPGECEWQLCRTRRTVRNSATPRPDDTDRPTDRRTDDASRPVRNNRIAVTACARLSRYRHRFRRSESRTVRVKNPRR